MTLPEATGTSGTTGEYGAGRYWVRWDQNGETQTNRYDDLVEAVRCYRQWQKEAGSVSACQEVREFRGKTAQA